MKRQELSQVVLWPMSNKATYSLRSPDIEVIDYDADGQEVRSYKEGTVLGRVRLNKPASGADIAKLMPADYTLEGEDINIINVNTKLVIGTAIPFDSEVVTERRVLSPEERLERLENIARRKAAREKAETKELRLRLAEMEKKALAVADMQREDVVEADEAQPDEVTDEQD